MQFGFRPCDRGNCMGLIFFTFSLRVRISQVDLCKIRSVLLMYLLVSLLVVCFINLFIIIIIDSISNSSSACSSNVTIISLLSML